MQVRLSKTLFSVLAITIMLVMAPFVALRYELIKTQLDQQLVDEARQVAVRVAESVKPSVWNEYIAPEEVTFSAGVTEAILRAEMAAPSITAIAISDSFEQLFLGFYKKDGQLAPLSTMDNRLLSQLGQQKFVQPIVNQQKSIGTVQVFYRTEQVESTIARSLSIELVQFAIVSLLMLALLYSALRQALIRPIQSLQIAHQAIDSLSEAVVVTDQNFRITDINQAYEKISGEAESTVLMTKPRFYIQHGDEQKLLWECCPSNLSSWEGEVLFTTHDGSQVPTWLQINEVIHNHRFVCYVGIVTDITDKKRVERQLHQMAYFDALTSLPNRTYFMETLNHEIMDAQRHDKRLGLLFIDLDNFKWINDNYGHGIGDQFLQSIATRFKARLRRSDFIFRLSGDEFTAIASEVVNEPDLEILANELIRIACEEVKLDGKTIAAGASIGVAIYPRDGCTSEELIQHADAAMYQAKENGRNQACFFSLELEQQRRNNHEIQIELNNAIENNELQLFYQPKLFHPAATTQQRGRVDGAEALIRWEHPQKGLIKPSDFIRVAEQTDQIVAIGNWVIKAACQQLAQWQGTEFAHISLAVNLSPRQLRHPQLVANIADNLRNYGINPAMLELEITESAIIENIELSLTTLNQLKNLGVGLAMDDFGTGFSSLSYLKLLPIDVIKIDRSFVAGLPYDEDDTIIVRAIFSMAEAMNLKVVAEGIENTAQEQYLLRQGCRHSQGYLYSKPLSLLAFQDWTRLYGNMPSEWRPGPKTSP